MVYDPSSNAMIVFGGSTVTGTLQNDVWILANANGLDRATGNPVIPNWSLLTVAGTPPAPRKQQEGTHIPSTNSLIIFGGTTQSSPGNFADVNDVWVLTNANGAAGGTPTWTQIAISGTPPAGREVSQNWNPYDPATNRLIVFWGQDGTRSSLVVYSDSFLLGPVLSISPVTGERGQTIPNFTVEGNNFDSNAKLSFGGTGIIVNSYIARTATKIVASISIDGSAAVGPRDVVVTNPNVQPVVSPGAFNVLFRSSPKKCDIASVTVDDSLSHGTMKALPIERLSPCQFKITIQGLKFYWADLTKQPLGDTKIQQVGLGAVGLLPPATVVPPSPTVSYIVSFASPKDEVRITADLPLGGPAFLLNIVEGPILVLQDLGKPVAIFQLATGSVDLINDAFNKMPHLRASFTLNPIISSIEFAKFISSAKETAVFNNLLTQLSGGIVQEIISEMASTPGAVAQFAAYILNTVTTAAFGSVEGDLFFTAQ